MIPFIIQGTITDAHMLICVKCVMIYFVSLLVKVLTMESCWLVARAFSLIFQWLGFCFLFYILNNNNNLDTEQCDLFSSGYY